MKSIRFMLVLFAAIAAARADDITLTDGRSFAGVTITGQTPRHITIRHSSGIAQIEKTSLPPSLRALYPVDEVAAERARLAFEERRAAAAVEREAQAKLILAQRAIDIAAREAAEASAKKEGVSALKLARERAERDAERYFRTQWRPGNNEVHVNDCSLRINLMEPNTAAPGAWAFSGEAWVGYYLALSRGQKGSRRVPFEGRIDSDGKITIEEKL
jgi:hypothetical protein